MHNDEGQGRKFLPVSFLFLFEPHPTLPNEIFFCYHHFMNLRPGIYEHSKTGNLYRVIGIAKHSENLEELVVYEALYDNPTSKFWVRPLTMFLEEIEVERKASATI